MKNAQENLKKRLRSDTIMSYIITGLIGVCAIIQVIDFFIVLDTVKIAGEAYKGTDPVMVLRDGIQLIFVAVAVLLLSLILKEIHLTGKPFSMSNVKRLRTMAGVLILGSFAGEAANLFAGLMMPPAVKAAFSGRVALGPVMVFIVFGVVCGLIAEIFHYGYTLQDDVDAIA